MWGELAQLCTLSSRLVKTQRCKNNMECGGKNKCKCKFCPSAEAGTTVANKHKTENHSNQNRQQPKTAPPATAVTAATTQNDYCYSVFVIEDGRNNKENLVYDSQQSSIEPPYTMTTSKNKQYGNSPRHLPFPGVYSIL
eukprot:11067282-Ditylum_brightwellii.AAC.1